MVYIEIKTNEYSEQQIHSIYPISVRIYMTEDIPHIRYSIAASIALKPIF